MNRKERNLHCRELLSQMCVVPKLKMNFGTTRPQRNTGFGRNECFDLELRHVWSRHIAPGLPKDSHHCMQDAHETTNPSLLKTVLQLQKNTSCTRDTKECGAVRLTRTVWLTSGEASITERAGSKAKTYEKGGHARATNGRRGKCLGRGNSRPLLLRDEGTCLGRGETIRPTKVGKRNANHIPCFFSN